MGQWNIIQAEHNRKWCEWHDLAYSRNPKAPRPPEIQAQMDQLMREMADLIQQANAAYAEEHPND